MLRKFLLIFTLIYVIKCKRHPHYSVENLYTILDRTSEYFKTLKNGNTDDVLALIMKFPRSLMKLSILLAHESTNNDISNIDGKIAKYMEATTKVILQRQQRSLRDDSQFSEGEFCRQVLRIHLRDKFYESRNGLFRRKYIYYMT